MSEIPVPTLCRLENEKSNVMHAALNLLDPSAYVARLEERGKPWRAIELDERLQPLGRLWGSTPTEPSRTSPTTHTECPVCLGTLCEDGAPVASCLF